jgi:hypothetical protein
MGWYGMVGGLYGMVMGWSGMVMGWLGDGMGWYGMVRDGMEQIGLDRLSVLRKCD